MKKSILIFAIMLFSFSLFSGCTGPKSEETQKPVIAVSIVPEKEFVRSVAGDLVDIVTMIPPGSSPANYQPSPAQMESFSEASIYFVMGVPAEESGILKKAKELNPDIKIVRLDEEVSKKYPHRYFSDSHEHEAEYSNDSHEEEQGVRDPHIWMSPKRVIVMIDVIERELSLFDNKNSDTYSQNAASYRKKLQDLDASINNSLEKLENRTFIIYHPSLGYFADDYNLNMLSVEVSGKQASAKELQSIIEFARGNNIKVVFHQAEIDSAQSQTLADEIGGKTSEISPLSGNYIENMKKITGIFTEVLR